MYVSKEDFLLEIAAGRSVLHLGCVGFTDVAPAQRAGLAQQSLHWKLTQLADATGVDRSTAVIDEYRKSGLFDNIVPGDVECLNDVPITRKFEVVLAGDIIEHLSNPGRMLDGIRRFCDEQTRVVITTPNAFGAPNFVRYALGKFREGDEHVMCFNPQNFATLLDRHGYWISELHTCFQPLSAGKHAGVLFRLGRKTLEAFPQFGGTLLAVARLKPTAVQ